MAVLSAMLGLGGAWVGWRLGRQRPRSVLLWALVVLLLVLLLAAGYVLRGVAGGEI